ncbi:MAG: phosphatase PAP2 family protein [Rhizobiaceae bacterium]
MVSKTLDGLGTENSLSENVREALFEHRIYLTICGFYFSLTALFFDFSGYGTALDFLSGFFRFLANSSLLAMVAIAIFAAKLLILDRPKTSPFMYVYNALRAGPLSRDNIPRCVVAMLGLSAVMSAFLFVKPAIPLIKPFAYDQLFEQWDRTIHFGYQPWEILQGILGYEWITLIIHRSYYLWFPVIYVTFFWQVATRDNRNLRMQFILSFVGCWIVVGSIMAIAMSSVGPIYFDQVVYDDPAVYSAGVAYLSGLNSSYGLYMFEVKEMLWNHYTGVSENNLVRGISAMPSMHVSLAFLLVLFGWSKGPVARAFYSVFALVIGLGSVHLLWHYAIDGYVAIIATWIIWMVSGVLANKHLPPANQ